MRVSMKTEYGVRALCELARSEGGGPVQMRKALRDAVRQRARNRCEYCHIWQDDVPFVRHQIEHVIPRQHRGGNRHAGFGKCGEQETP